MPRDTEYDNWKLAYPPDWDDTAREDFIADLSKEIREDLLEHGLWRGYCHTIDRQEIGSYTIEGDLSDTADMIIDRLSLYYAKMIADNENIS